MDVNETACHMLGYSREELLQLGVSDISVGYPRRTAEQWAAKVAEIKESQTFQTAMGLHRRKDGSTYPVEVI